MDEQIVKIDPVAEGLAKATAAITEVFAQLACLGEKFVALTKITRRLCQLVREGSQQQQWGADWLHEEVFALEAKCRDLTPEAV